MFCLTLRKVDRKLRKLCPLLFKVLDRTCPNYAVVGGAIRSILENRSVRDIDIICEGIDAVIATLPDFFPNICIAKNSYNGYKLYIKEYDLEIDIWDTTNHIIPFDKIDDKLYWRLGWNFNAIYYCPKTKYLYLDSYNEAKNMGILTYNDSPTTSHQVILSVSDLIAYLTWKTYNPDCYLEGIFLQDKVRQLFTDLDFGNILEAYQKHYHKLPPDKFILTYYHEKYKN